MAAAQNTLSRYQFIWDYNPFALGYFLLSYGQPWVAGVGQVEG